jgi:hypothetical protein
VGKGGALEEMSAFAQSKKEAFALSAICNQGSLGTILDEAALSISQTQIVDRSPDSYSTVFEFGLKRLSNGNVLFSLNYLTGVSAILNRDDGGGADGVIFQRPWTHGDLANEDHYDEKVAVSIEFDAKALKDGNLKEVASTPFIYKLNIEPDPAMQ